MRRFKYVLVFIIIASVNHGYTQVSWGSSLTLTNAQDAVVRITANIAPGWRLYSQAIREGGPMPTRFSFGGGAYALTSPIRERGDATTYYDVMYEMEVTSYAGIVHFEQDVILEGPATTLTGKVEYMVCNNELCVPGEEEFSIKISP